MSTSQQPNTYLSESLLSFYKISRSLFLHKVIQDHQASVSQNFIVRRLHNAISKTRNKCAPLARIVCTGNLGNGEGNLCNELTIRKNFIWIYQCNIQQGLLQIFLFFFGNGTNQILSNSFQWYQLTSPILVSNTCRWHS